MAAAPKQDDLASGVKIHHERKAPAPAAPTAEEKPEAPTPAPAKKKEENPEDGVVLRWR